MTNAPQSFRFSIFIFTLLLFVASCSAIQGGLGTTSVGNSTSATVGQIRSLTLTQVAGGASRILVDELIYTYLETILNAQVSVTVDGVAAYANRDGEDFYQTEASSGFAGLAIPIEGVTAGGVVDVTLVAADFFTFRYRGTLSGESDTYAYLVSDFEGGGWATLPSDYPLYDAELGYFTTSFYDAVFASDGKILVGGMSVLSQDADFAFNYLFTRFDADGGVDTTFAGESGYVWVSGSGYRMDMEAFFDGDEKLVILSGVSQDVGYRLSVCRLTSDGFDSEFGEADGCTAVGNLTYEEGSKMAPTPNGGVIVASWDLNAATFSLRRLDAAGAFDANYGVDGEALPPDGFTVGGGTSLADGSVIQDMIVDASGRMVIAVAIDSSISFIRYDAAGLVDTTFGTNGVLELDLEEAGVWALEMDSQGRILIAGDHSTRSGVASGGTYAYFARVTSSGTFDTSFGASGSGVVTEDYDQLAEVIPSRIAFDSQNRIVVAGQGLSSQVVWRLEDNGAFDTSFGTMGVVAYFDTCMKSSSAPAAILIDADDIIVVGGYSAGMAKLDGTTGAVDTSFGGSVSDETCAEVPDDTEAVFDPI